MKVEYKHYKLENGMEVLLIPSDTTYSITLSANIKSGSAYEIDGKYGITHFIEHLSLKSTKKWPTKEKIIKVTEFNGASYNGGTGRELLNYYINVPFTKLEFGIDFISEVLFNANFNERSVEQEKHIILDELDKNENSVYSRNYRYFLEKFTENKSLYINDLGGTKESVSNINMNDLKSHYKKVHDVSKTLLVIVGKFKESEANGLIKNHFDHKIPTNNSNELPLDKITSNKFLSHKDKKTNLVMCSIVIPSIGRNQMSTRTGIFHDLLITALGGLRSSRLYKRLRDDEALLYSIDCDSTNYEKFGFIEIFFEILPEKFIKTYKIVNEELEKYYESGLTQNELSHVKEYLINRFLVKYDNIHAYSKLIVNPIFRGQEVLELMEIIEIIKSLTLKEAKTLIKEYFNVERLSALAYGNITNDIKSYVNKLNK
jgi:predicted Zn-dependent peptidase